MAVICVSGPVVEPVTLAEAKLHCRIDVEEDDALVASLISTAREHLERISRPRVAMSAQRWLTVLDAWPASARIELRPWPLIEVIEVRYTDAEGAETVLAPSAYAVDTYSEPGRLEVLDGWPGGALAAMNGLQIEYTAGYDSETLPLALRQATLLLVAHWYEHRELAMTSGAVPKELPFAVGALIAPWRREV